MPHHKLFVWNQWHNGDILFSRPLIKRLLDQYDVEIIWCCFSNHAYLIRDLPVRLMVLPIRDQMPFEMSKMCPPDHISICLWIGHGLLNPPGIAWKNVVSTWNRQVDALGLPLHVESHGWIPMLDLPNIDIPVRDPAIYVDNAGGRSHQSFYQFDMAALAARFPDLNFYCAAAPKATAPNIIDCSSLNLIALASLSNKCVTIVGKGTGAQTCTWTETNRFKPRALMGFHFNEGSIYWDDYAGCQQSRFETHEQLVAYLDAIRAMPRMRLDAGAAGANVPVRLPSLAAIQEVSADDMRQRGMAGVDPSLLLEGRAPDGSGLMVTFHKGVGQKA